MQEYCNLNFQICLEKPGLRLDIGGWGVGVGAWGFDINEGTGSDIAAGFILKATTWI